MRILGRFSVFWAAEGERLLLMWSDSGGLTEELDCSRGRCSAYYEERTIAVACLGWDPLDPTTRIDGEWTQ